LLAGGLFRFVPDQHGHAFRAGHDLEVVARRFDDHARRFRAIGCGDQADHALVERGTRRRSAGQAMAEISIDSAP